MGGARRERGREGRGGDLVGCVDRYDVQLRRVQSNPKLGAHLKALYLNRQATSAWGKQVLADTGSIRTKVSQENTTS